jgi:ribosomal protein S5
MTQLETLLSENAKIRELVGTESVLEQIYKNSARLENIIRVAVDALNYIVSKKEFADKPKWAAEFIDVAKEAKAEMERIAGEK